MATKAGLNIREDERLISWASQAVKKPWYKMVEVGKNAIEEKTTSAADRMLEIPLFPITVDGEIVTWFLQKFLTTLLTENGSMHTIILNREGSRIIWSCIEAVHKGTYSELHEIGGKELGELNRKASTLIAKDDMKRVFDACRKFADHHYRINLGIVKVAHIQFFEEFRKVYEFSQNGELLINHVAGVLGAVTNIFKNKWLRFYPQAKIFSLLGKMITKGALDIAPEDIKSIMTSLLPPMRLGIGLRSDEWGVAIEFEAKKDGDFSLRIQDADFGQSCWNSSIQKFADNIRKKLRTSVAIAVEAEDLREIFRSMMDIGAAYNRDTFAALIATLGKIFPRYGEAFAISPRPNLYKGFYKWAYGLDLTRQIMVPATAVTRGVPLFIGSNGAFALGVLDDSGKLLTLLHIQMRGPLVMSIKTLDKSHYTKVVKNALKKPSELKLMQATKALKFAITEDTEQWLNYCVLVEKDSLSDIISKLMEFVKHMFWTSLLRPGEFKRFIRRHMSKEALTKLFEEKLTVYPSNPIFKLMEEKGVWTYKWPL
nr:hypothetical protein [Candidatus Njordarchaeum guaymaensis]